MPYFGELEKPSHFWSGLFSHSFSFTFSFFNYVLLPPLGQREREMLYCCFPHHRCWGSEWIEPEISCQQLSPVHWLISLSVSLSAHCTLQCSLILPLACLHLSPFIIFYYHCLFSPHMRNETYTSCLLMTRSWDWENSSRNGTCAFIILDYVMSYSHQQYLNVPRFTQNWKFPFKWFFKVENKLQNFTFDSILLAIF